MVPALDASTEKQSKSVVATGGERARNSAYLNIVHGEGHVRVFEQKKATVE